MKEEQIIQLQKQHIPDLYQLNETRPPTSASMKTIVERGASWTLEETKLLLSLWGQDLVQRQATNQKRTKEVYEKISEKFNDAGYERTPDQVRTRVFNMIAEYRRILRDTNPERMKKCIFFEPLHKIYQATNIDDVKSAVDDYEPDNPYSPASNTISSERGDESLSDSEVLDDTLTNKQQATNNNNHNSNSNDVIATAVTSNKTTVAPTNSSKNNTSGDKISDATSTNTDNNASQSNSKDASKEDSSSWVKRIKLNFDAPMAGTSNASNPSDTTNKQKVSTDPKTSQKAGSSSTNASSTSTNNVSAVKHQSLLLPHATSASTSASTPVSKLTTSAGTSTPSYINLNSTKFPIIRANQFLGHSNGNEQINVNGTPTATRLPTTAAIAGHQLYQAPVNTFDVTSSALLIDRMFAHLSRESENMREWIALEKERIAVERVRRSQETEREVRRERVLIDTLMRFQEQWISFVNRIDPRIINNAAGKLPELKIPPREVQIMDQQGSAADKSSGTSQSNSANTSAGTSVSTGIANSSLGSGSLGNTSTSSSLTSTSQNDSVKKE